MNTVLLDRLIENACIDMEKPFTWDNHKVSVSEVKQYIKQGGKGNPKFYEDVFMNQSKTIEPKEFHVARVAYFVQNPSEIQGITIDNYCYGYSIYPQAVIHDGWHRLMAAYILGMKKIKVNYGGREDLLRYLQGRRKTQPNI